MKIIDGYNTTLASIEGLNKNQKKAASGEKTSKSGKPGDAVKISSKGQEVAHARNLAMSAPEVRKNLVDEVVGLIGRGEYDVSGEEVAPKLIKEHQEWIE